MGWQPIETADKGLGLVLLASDHGHVVSGRWSPHFKGWATEVGTFHEGTRVKGNPCRITHWQPMPPPPGSDDEFVSVPRMEG